MKSARTVEVYKAEQGMKLKVFDKIQDWFFQEIFLGFLQAKGSAQLKIIALPLQPAHQNPSQNG